MMNIIYNSIHNKAWSSEGKNVFFLMSTMLFFAIAGILVWAVFFKAILPELSWLISFILYPTVFCGFFGGILFLYKK